MRRVRFQIKIKGPTPDDVGAGYLGGILQRLEEALAAYIQDRKIDIRSEEGPILSLVDVDEGSDLLTFSAPPPLAAAVAVISGALASRDYGLLPHDTHTGLYKVSEQVRTSGWGMQFLPEDKLGIREADLTTPDRGIEPPAEPPTVTGTTTILGRCLRVGGATHPKAEVRPSRGGSLLYLSVSEEQAKQLGRNLYEEVLLEGEVKWDVATWRMVDFKLKEVSEFQRTKPSEAFRELAESADGAWDDIDAELFVRQQRGDD